MDRLAIAKNLKQQNDVAHREVFMPFSQITATLVTCCLLSACTAQPQNPSFPVTLDQANHAVSDMRADPQPLPRPLVIIGGFMDPNVSPPLFKSYFSHITTADVIIIPVSVGLCGSFEQCRRKVIEAVDAACPSTDPNWTAQVDVVGASLGGLVARYAAAPSADASKPRRLHIVRLFTISSPHSGATLAQHFGFSDYHRDMRPGSAFLQSLAKSDATASYELYPYVHLHDELVGEQYAAPPGTTPFWLPNSPLMPAHGSAMVDPRILGDISRRLRNEEPLTIPPPAPLPQ